jgi:hypothetical protein
MSRNVNRVAGLSFISGGNMILKLVAHEFHSESHSQEQRVISGSKFHGINSLKFVMTLNYALVAIACKERGNS